MLDIITVLQTPLAACDVRAKSCSDLTCSADPVLRNLTELCKSLGVSDSPSVSALDSTVPKAGGGSLFDQQLIDCLKPGTFSSVSNIFSFI